jgi:hypothetical protein
VTVRFIEEWFGIWPDNGDGSFEILILVVLVALAVLIGMLLPIGGKPKKEDETSSANDPTRSTHAAIRERRSSKEL